MPYLQIILALLLTSTALADQPVIEAVTATKTGAHWRFDVTLRHADTGWDDYADAWEVLSPDGTRLGIRILLHPHVTEQPFTRALTGVIIPSDITRVSIRARTNADGWASTLFPLALD